MMDDVIKRLYEEYADMQAMVDLLQADKRNLMNSILTKEQRAMMAEIEEEFSAPIMDGLDKLKEAAQTLKDAVVASGKSHNSEDAYQIVYTKGRVSWNDKKLQDMVFDYPPLAQARKVGNPYAVIRIRKTR